MRKILNNKWKISFHNNSYVQKETDTYGERVSIRISYFHRNKVEILKYK